MNGSSKRSSRCFRIFLRLTAMIVVCATSSKAAQEDLPYFHEIEITPRMRAEIAAQVIQQAIEYPNEFNLITLQSIMDSADAVQVMQKIRSVKVNESRQPSAQSGGRLKPVLQVRSSRFLSTDSACAFDLSLRADAGIDVLTDSCKLSVKKRGAGWVLIGMTTATPVIERVSAKAEELLAVAKSENREPKQSSVPVITDYTSPNLLRPSVISQGISVLSSNTSIQNFDNNIFNRPSGIGAYIYKDAVLPDDLNHSYLFCMDANWDRMIMSGRPLYPAEGDEWIRSEFSHGSAGPFNMSCPGGIDFAGLRMYVADSYNHRVAVFTFSPGHDDIVFVRDYKNSYGVVPDVGTGWILNRQDYQSQIAEIAILDQTHEFVEIIDMGGTVKKRYNSSDFFNGHLTNPTSVCYSRHFLDNFNGTWIFIADAGNNRIVGRSTLYYDQHTETPPGLFPADAYITSVETDYLGSTVFAVDDYNAKIYALHPGLQYIIGIYGSKGTGPGQFMYPQNISQTIGWKAGVSENQNEPIPNGDILVSESWGPTTGIKKFVRGFDVLDHEISYQEGAVYGWDDQVNFSWFQSGPTTAVVEFFDTRFRFDNDFSPVQKDTITLAQPWWVDKSIRFLTPGDTTLTYYVRVKLWGLFDHSFQETIEDSITFTRAFNSGIPDDARFEVSDYSVFEPNSGQPVDRIFGGRYYMAQVNVRDRIDSVSTLWYQWTSGAPPSHITFADNYDGPYDDHLITTSNRVWFKPDHQAIADSQEQRINCWFGWYDIYNQVWHPYAPCQYCEQGGPTPPTEAEAVQVIKLPYFCVPPGQSCPATPPPPPSCPFLYAWTGENFSFVNNILPQAEVYPGSYRTDWQMLPSTVAMDSGHVRLQISEEEREQSSLDQLALFAVDLPDSFSDVRITNLHELVGGQDSIILPSSAMTDEGTDVLSALIAEDSVFLESHDSGYVDLEYDFSFPLSGKEGGSSKATGSAPGGLDPLDPPKNMTKIGPSADSLYPIAYFVSVDTGNGNYLEVTKIAPRLTETNEVVKLSDYIINGVLKVRIGWNCWAKLDYLPFLRYSEVQPIVTQLPLVSAEHSLLGSVISQVLDVDSASISLEPYQILDLQYGPGPQLDSGYYRRYVFQSVGTYRRIPWEEEPPPDSSGGTSGFSFEPNYPNPANPSTTFHFSLPQSGHVVLNVYNVLGQKVATLIDDVRQAGSYTAQWDGRVNGKQTASSGVYFAKLTAGTYTATRKVVMVK